VSIVPQAQAPDLDDVVVLEHLVVGREHGGVGPATATV
jgi:hypothetical protein